MKLIFLHGLGQDETSWAQVQKELTDYPNKALKLFPNGQENYDQVKNKLLKQLQEEKEPFLLVGLSLGGVLALDLSRHKIPLLKGLVLSGTQYKLKRNLLYSLQILIFKALPKWLFQRQGTSKKQMVTLLEDLRELDLTETVKHTQIPSLVLCGTNDKANLRSAQELKRLLPHTSLELIEKGGHTLNTQCPQAFAQMIEAFIEKITPSF